MADAFADCGLELTRVGADVLAGPATAGLADLLASRVVSAIASTRAATTTAPATSGAMKPRRRRGLAGAGRPTGRASASVLGAAVVCEGAGSGTLSRAVARLPTPARAVCNVLLSACRAARVWLTSVMVGRVCGSALSIRSRSGVSGPLRCGESSWPEATRCSTAIALSSWPNGGLPSVAVYSVEPSENTSDAKLADWPRATSGARYAGVPVTMPVAVSVTSPRTCEIPKSVSLAVPSSASNTLPGLTSRCTMPA